jgi:tRNA1(Val) A37 N6-methylase TrmN6
MRTLDFLPKTDIHLYQDSDMFRINSDTCALGEFIQIKKSDIVLDIGTNNGALLLYANRLGSKKLIGVDINGDAIDLCQENMALNGIKNYELYKGKVQDLNIEKVDVILCNPPYFKNSIVNENEKLKKARHEETLTMEELIDSASRLLKNGGSFFCVYKTTEMIRLIVLLDKYNFGITKIKMIFDENKDTSNVFLIEAIKNRKRNVKAIKPLIISHK